MEAMKSEKACGYKGSIHFYVRHNFYVLFVLPLWLSPKPDKTAFQIQILLCLSQAHNALGAALEMSLQVPSRAVWSKLSKAVAVGPEQLAEGSERAPMLIMPSLKVCVKPLHALILICKEPSGFLLVEVIHECLELCLEVCPTATGHFRGCA